LWAGTVIVHIHPCK